MRKFKAGVIIVYVAAALLSALKHLKGRRETLCSVYSIVTTCVHNKQLHFEVD